MEVYARAARVRLLMNDRTVGEKALKGDCIARFRCTYEDGTVTAVALDAHREELGRTTLGTAGPETQLRADPEAPSVAPGRLSYIRLRYTRAVVCIELRRFLFRSAQFIGLRKRFRVFCCSRGQGR